MRLRQADLLLNERASSDANRSSDSNDVVPLLENDRRVDPCGAANRARHMNEDDQDGRVERPSNQRARGMNEIPGN